MMEIKHRVTGEVLRILDADTLVGADLRDDILDCADLRNADLSRAWLQEADLSGADLSGARLDGALMIRTQLDGANLEGAVFTGTRMSDGSPGSGAVLTNSNMRNVTIEWDEGFPTRVRLGSRWEEVLSWAGPWRRSTAWGPRSCASPSWRSACAAGGWPR